MNTVQMHSILRRLFGYAKHKARTVANQMGQGSSLGLKLHKAGLQRRRISPGFNVADGLALPAPADISVRFHFGAIVEMVDHADRPVLHDP
jgi:hypothetical protein